VNPVGSTSSFPAGLTSAQNSGLATIAEGSLRLSQDAQQIANPDSPNMTNALLDLSQSLLTTEAGADVISTSNRMLGSLLDVLA
jgi:hypothetical protein